MNGEGLGASLREEGPGAPLRIDGGASRSSPAALAGLDALYRRYSRPLREFCRERLGDAVEAEDACHEAMIKAQLALSRMQPRKMWPWLATIAANICVDIQRKRSRVVSLNGQSAPRYEDPPDQEVTARIRQEVVRKAMSRLPAHYRSHIRLADYEGWSYADIARWQGVTVGAVGSTLLRAREALKAHIKRVAREMGQWPLPGLVSLGTGRRWRFDDLSRLCRGGPGRGRWGPHRLWGVCHAAPGALQSLVAEATTAAVLFMGVVSTGGSVSIASGSERDSTAASEAREVPPETDVPGDRAGLPFNDSSNERPRRRVATLASRVLASERAGGPPFSLHESARESVQQILGQLSKRFDKALAKVADIEPEDIDRLQLR